MSSSTFPLQHTVDPDIKHNFSVPVSQKSVSARSHANDASSALPGPHTQPISSRHQNQPTNATSISSRKPNQELEVSAELFRNRIVAVASTNSALLVTLRDTSHAPAALAQKGVHIFKLREELSEQERAIEDVERRLEESKPRSNGGGFLLVLKQASLSIFTLLRRKKTKASEQSPLDNAGNGTSTAEQKDADDTAYFTLLSEKSRSQQRKNELLQQIESSSDEEKDLQLKASKHETAHSDLDNLYNSLFSGPTPGFPSEDAAESAFHRVQTLHEGNTATVLARRRAGQFIQQVQRNWKNAGIYLKDASIRAERGSGILGFSDVKSDLRNVEHYATIAGTGLEKSMLNLAPLGPEIYELAQRMEGIVRGVRSVSIPVASWGGKAELLEAISGTKQHWESGNEVLEQLLYAAKEEERGARLEVRESARELDERRSALQQVRQEVFEQVAGFGEAPPAYHNCCSRTEAYKQQCDVVVELDDEETAGTVEQ
ncbi:hypothetical protein BCR34DRAFT_608030 [Clohesyomyces aquaticus]|uniref:Uncharacterized protein n=1 Tax=Clohesyomyces aquaticus TaxID=1231657 RepID=A0A1Y1YBS5_9PLEO|nr:hypothetical protein BCR34DRAFT_608030 [Clohesyomyces aquaticus]